MTDQTTRWAVLKFGGTSVSSADNWAIIASVLRDRLTEGYRPVVVHSALRGVTTALDTVAEAALDRQHPPLIDEIDARHDKLATELGLSAEETADLLGSDRAQLRELAEGIALVGELTPRTRARLLSLGERMSTRLGAAYLRTQNVRVTWFDARDFMTSLERRPGNEHAAYLSAECSADPDPNLV
ncbi:MAG: bifunctional aspartate kinase/diaminopimelate decarboxylase, partial [Gemmatimonadota bacterium]